MVERTPDFVRNVSAGGKGGAFETPTYESKVAIQPQASPQGAQQAFSGIESAFDTLGAMGAKVASDASQQRASQQALLDAQNPQGQTPTMGFGSSADKAYVHAYEQQSANVLTYQGQKDLDMAYNTYAQDPTPQGLADYEHVGRQAIQNMSALGTNTNRFHVEQALDAKFQNNFMNLSNAVQHKIKQQEASNYKFAYDQGLENQLSYGQAGMFDALNSTTESLKQNNDSALASGAILEGEHKANEKTIAINDATSRNMYNLLQAEKAGKGDAFLQEFIDKPPAGLSPVEAQTVGTNLYKQLSAFRALRSGQQQIDYTHALMAVENGQLTPSSFEDWRGKLSGEQFASVEKQYQHQQLELLKAQKGVVDITTYGNNAFELAKMSDKDFEGAFDQLVSRSAFNEDPILNSAIVTSNIKRNNPGFTKQLEETLTYGGPEESLSAAEAVTYLQNQNSGQSIQGMDKQSRAIGELYKLYRRNPDLKPEDALQQARDQVLKVDKSTYEVRADVLKQQLSQRGLDTSTIRKRVNETLSTNKAFSRKFLWAEGTKIPDDATAAYTNALISYSLNGLDFKEANKNAVMDMIASYPQTNINGGPERMAYADKMPYGNDVLRNRQNMSVAVQALVQRNKIAQQQGIPLTQKLDYDPKSGTFTVNGVKREIKVKGDYLTDIKRGGAWAFYVTDDKGLQIDVIDPSAPDRKARWIPSAVKSLTAPTPTPDISSRELPKLAGNTVSAPMSDLLPRPKELE